MAFPNDIPPRGTDNVRYKIRPATIGWVTGGAILLVLLSLSFFYTGRGTHPKSGENAGNTETQTQTQPQR